MKKFLRYFRRDRLWGSLFLGAACTLAFWLYNEWRSPSLPIPRDIVLSKGTKWISVPDDSHYGGYFRLDFDLKSPVKRAWLLVGAEGGFEVSTNGNTLGAYNLWRPTRPFNNGLTEAGQRAVSSEPAIVFNFPREYQWTGHANYKMPIYFDLRPGLKRGHNCICIDIESRKTGSAIVIDGAVELADGTVHTLQSSPLWKAEPTPKGMTLFEWARPDVDVTHWRNARIVDAPSGKQVSFVPSDLFKKNFEGHWMVADRLKGALVDQGGQDFVYEWEQNGHPEEAWIRIAAQGPYLVMVNGIPLRPASREKSGLADGGWLVGWGGRRPLSTPPTLVDPDETADYFVGYRFENPRHGDPTINDFKVYENMLNRTRERPTATKAGEELDDKFQEKGATGRMEDPYGFYEEPDTRVPLELVRERAEEEQKGFAFARLIKPGKNEVRIRMLHHPVTAYGKSRLVKVATDGVVEQEGGGGIRLTSGEHWRSEWKNNELPLNVGNHAMQDGLSFPRLKYYGESRLSQPWKLLSILWGGSLAIILLALSPFLPFLGREKIRGGAAVFAVCCFLLGLVKISFFERSEQLAFRDGQWAMWGLLAALAISTVTVLFRAKRPQFRLTPAWWVGGLTLFSLLLLTFVLRAWRVEHQPIDDDEFASIQAIASIAEKGVPELAEGIWYSRSPGYHYFAGAAAWLFGTNLWTLRLFTVLTAVATGWLVWSLARTYFKSQWIAGAATLIFAIHPFVIFTGHIARFYQQQQLFVLLTLHLFVQGFLLGRGTGWRIAAIASFAFAVVSQEISIAVVPTLILLYALFGKNVRWRAELSTVLAVVIAATAIALDIFLFQLKCMTRAPGVSPNVEATIAPTFWELGNLLSMIIGYSRLHVALSFFYFISLFWCLAKGKARLTILHVMLLGTIVFYNLLITSSSFRYQYTLIPIWILLGVHGIWLSGRYTSRWTGNRAAGVTVQVVALLAVVLSFSPWRIPGSYSKKILGDPISGLRHVKAHWREGDKIMITEPHPHAAKMELGQVDYDLVVPILYDFTYSDNGLLRDRNGGAEAVNRLSRLQEIFAEDKRVWIMVNREKFRSRKKNLRWEYPTAREELFFRQNCQLAYRSYLWYVYLWDMDEARYHAFRREPGSWVE